MVVVLFGVRVRKLVVRIDGQGVRSIYEGGERERWRALCVCQPQTSDPLLHV